MADLIGSWDPTNCVFGMFPENLKLARDNTDQEHVNLENFNTGGMPLYQGESAGGFISGTLTNMATGYGYNDGKIVFDGTDDYILTNHSLSITDISEDTAEFRINRVDATAYYLGGVYDDISNYYLYYIGADNKVWLSIVVGGTLKRTKTTDTISSGLRTITYERLGSTCKIYFDGVEVSGYEYQETYNSGNKTFTNPFRLGHIGLSPAYLADMYSFTYYDDAIGSTRILANHNLGSAMGLTVADRQLNEMLTVQNVKRSIGTRTIQTGLSGVISADQWEITMSADTEWNEGDEISIDTAGTPDTRYVYSRTGNVFRLQSKTTKSGTLTCSIVRSYTTMQAWETDRQGNLITLGTIEKGICYADSTFTVPVSLTGSTTDNTHFMWLTVAEDNRHDGTASGGGVVIQPAPNSANPITISDDFSVVQWIRVNGPTGCAGGNRRQVSIAANNVYVSNIVCHGFTGTSAVITSIRIDASFIATVANCIIFDNSGTFTTVIGIYGGVTGKINNCTVYKMISSSNGIGLDQCISKNCISMGHSNSAFTNIKAGSDYNLADDATPTGGNSLINKTASNQFVDLTPGSEDLNLKAGSDAIGAGLDLSSELTKDCAGKVRPGIWDMGALSFLVKAYTRESAVSLPADNTDLATVYEYQDYVDVVNDDGNRVDMYGANSKVLQQFKDRHLNSLDPFNVSWQGQTDLAPSTSAVYLQIYNTDTNLWETLDSDNSSGVSTDFFLTGAITVNTEDYYEDDFITCRVYQDVSV